MTMVDTRTNYAKEISQLVNEAYGDNIKIFENSIPIPSGQRRFPQQESAFMSMMEKGKAALAYEALTKEVLSNE